MGDGPVEKSHVIKMTPEQQRLHTGIPNPSELPFSQARRMPPRHRRISKESVALNVATAGAVAIMAAPVVGQGISNAVETGKNVAGWVSERINRPQPADVLSEQSAQDTASSRKMEADFSRTTPSPNSSGTK